MSLIKKNLPDDSGESVRPKFLFGLGAGVQVHHILSCSTLGHNRSDHFPKKKKTKQKKQANYFHLAALDVGNLLVSFNHLSGA